MNNILNIIILITSFEMFVLVGVVLLFQTVCYEIVTLVKLKKSTIVEVKKGSFLYTFIKS